MSPCGSDILALRKALHDDPLGRKGLPVPESLAWVREGAGPFGSYGPQLVQAELDEYKQALEEAEHDPARLRRAVRSLESAALREDLQGQLSLGTLLPTDPFGRAQHAALLARFDEGRPRQSDKEILFLLKSTDARVPRAMLEELGRRKWLDRFADWEPADDASASVLRAYATASSDATDKRIICRVVALIAHESRGVRRDAAAALFAREGGEALLAEYDPTSPSMAEHEAMRKRAAAHFGCE